MTIITFIYFRDANWEWVDSDKRPLEFSYDLVPKILLVD